MSSTTAAPRMTLDSGAFHPADVAQHARRDPDAGRRERRPDKQVDIPCDVPGEESGRHGVAERHRRDDPQQRHADDRGSHTQQFFEVALETDLEQQQNHADFGRDRQEWIALQRIEELESKQTEVAQNDADEQLTQHRGLTEPLDQLAADLGGDKDGGKRHQEGRHVAAVRPLLGAGQPPRAEDDGGNQKRAASQEPAVLPHAARNGWLRACHDAFLPAARSSAAAAGVARRICMRRCT